MNAAGGPVREECRTDARRSNEWEYTPNSGKGQGLLAEGCEQLRRKLSEKRFIEPIKGSIKLQSFAKYPEAVGESNNRWIDIAVTIPTSGR